MKYKYKYRKSAHSENFIIEFFQLDDADDLVYTLLDLLRDIKAKVKRIPENSFDDEYQLEVATDIGKFRISRQAFDGVLIFSEENNTALEKLNALLSHDGRFERI